MAVNGAYAPLRSLYNKGLVFTMTSLSDERTTAGTNSYSHHLINHFQVDPNDLHTYDQWMELYTIVARCNLIIDKIDEIDYADEELAKSDQTGAESISSCRFKFYFNSAFIMNVSTSPKLFFYIILLTFFSCANQDGQVNRERILSQLDIAPNENQVDYSPADGAAVKVNPPPFTWLPVRKDITYPADYVAYSGPEEKVWRPIKDNNHTYTLQISRDQDFSSDVITREGIEISTYALEESLEAGEWFWRYGVEDGTTIFSKARRFAVPSDVKKNPFPDMKEVVNTIPDDHPKLFVLKDEIESYRNRASDGDLKKTVVEIKAEIEKHIGEELPKEPKYVKGIGPEFGEHSWRLIYDAVIPPCDMMEEFGLVYLLTGDKKYGEEARRRVLHFSSWNPDGSTSDRAHDEPAMRILAQGSRAYDWTYELFTPEERKMVEKSMIRRGTQFYERLKYSADREYQVYNRGSHEERVCGFLGEAAIVYMDKTDEAKDWLEYALTIHWNLWPAWAKNDGGWHQGPSYWTAYEFRVLHFLTALKKATNVDLIDKDFFQNTPYYILYSNPPYAKLSPFGDGEDRAPDESRGEMMYNYSSLLKDPYIRWYADFMNLGHGKNILGILLKNDDLKGKAPLDLPQSRYFSGIGLVSLHTNFGNAEEDIHFLFHSDPYGGVSHGHPDQNAFTIEAFGEALAIASGYYPWYGSEHHKKWQRQTKSSNSITINGWKGQEGEAAAKGKVVTFENKELYDYILGDATQAYMGLLNKFQRHVIHIRPGVYVMYDDLEAPEPVNFEWWLHALSEMKMDERKKSITISQGDVRLKVNLVQSDKVKFDQFSGFPDPPEVRGETTPDYKDQWHVTVSTPSKNTKAKFISVLVPYKKENEPDISIDHVVEEENKVSLELKVDDKKYFVSFKPEVSVKEIAL